MGKSSRHSFLSDESSIYGNDDQKAELEEQSDDIDPVEWFANKPITLMEVAANNKENQYLQEKTALYNRYHGLVCGRQLAETVEEFLERLPPATTYVSDLIPWIYIGNPYIPIRGFEHRDNTGKNENEGSSEVKSKPMNMGEEGPLDETDEDGICNFRTLGEALLSEYETRVVLLRKEMQGKSAGKLDYALRKVREEMVEQLKQYAVEYNCIGGKWLLFKDSSDVNEVWSLVAQKTASNDLGIAAKVGPRNLDQTDSRNPQVICVYTKDFTDVEDVTLILRKLKDMGLVDVTRPIYYKCDAYTYLGINSSNKWGIKASLYGSTEMLRPKSKKIDPYLNKSIHQSKQLG